MEEQVTYSSPADIRDAAYHVSYRLTMDEADYVYRQIMWVHKEISPTVHNVFHLLIAALPLLAMVRLISFLMEEGSILACIFFGLAGITGMWLLLLKLREVNVLKYLKWMQTVRAPSDLYGTREMWFSDDFIRLEAKLGRLDLPWSNYSYIFETEDTYFLIQLTGDRKESYLFLPKMSLGGPERQEAFVSFCMEHGLKAQMIRTFDSESSVKGAGRPKMTVLFFVTVILLVISVSMLYFELIYNYLFSV